MDVYGEERLDLPQLFLKDDTILNVTDYWLVDDQLHFTIIEENGTRPVEHTIPLDVLDLQTTFDANTRRGSALCYVTNHSSSICVTTPQARHPS